MPEKDPGRKFSPTLPKIPSEVEDLVHHDQMPVESPHAPSTFPVPPYIQVEELIFVKFNKLFGSVRV